MAEERFDVTVYPPNDPPMHYCNCPEVKASEDAGFVLFTTHDGIRCKTNLPTFTTVHTGE